MMNFARLLSLIVFLAATLGSSGCSNDQRRLRGPQNAFEYRQYAPSSNQPPLPENNISLTKESVYSAELRQSIAYYILYPPSYIYNQARSYPVIIWLHGANGSQKSLRPLAERFIRAMGMGLMNDSIVIFPESEPLSMWVNSKNGTYPIESLVIEVMLPHIKKTLRVSTDRKDYYISGFSMGGYGAARLGFKYPNIFGSIVMVGAGTLDSTLDNTPRASRSVRDSVMQKVYGNDEAYFLSNSPRSISKSSPARRNPNVMIDITIIAGTADEVYEQNQNFNTYLESIGYRTKFISLLGVPHNLRDYVQAARVALFGSLGRADQLSAYQPHMAISELQLAYSFIHR